MLCLLFFPCLPASAETDTLALTITEADGTPLAKLTDASELSAQNISAGQLQISSTENIGAVYIVFDEICTDWGVVTPQGNRALGENGFLHAFTDLSGVMSQKEKCVTLYFNSGAAICEIYAFASAENLPDWVQVWQPPCEKADMLLLSSHSDDEQLFFAGLLPYYAGERRLAVQVAYFTNHDNHPRRRHEQLNGLWTVGVRNYPVIGKLPDLYADSKASALNNWARYGFTETDIVASQTELLRRFQPQVVVAHDINGEYGHGAHILNTDTLLQALAVSDDATRFPESAEVYGTYKPKKVYLHLYEKNPVIMNWDMPLSSFGGKTAYAVSCAGFDCHTSQHWTWFKKWLRGTEARPITAAKQIETYSPCQYGLYATEVGTDTTGGDLFENLTSYAEQEQQAKAEETKRLAEEKRKKEKAEQKVRESTLKKQRLWGLFAFLLLGIVIRLIYKIRKKRK
ncbi:MAG: PIG-L family deacetylase [Clostridia bacterium]|nr:PIG-L family deacetylase [Clostridia bacterium]